MLYAVRDRQLGFTAKCVGNLTYFKLSGGRGHGHVASNGCQAEVHKTSENTNFQTKNTRKTQNVWRDVVRPSTQCLGMKNRRPYLSRGIFWPRSRFRSGTHSLASALASASLISGLVKKPVFTQGVLFQFFNFNVLSLCLLYTSPSPRDGLLSRMPSSA